MKTVALSVGGSALSKEDGWNTEFAEGLVKLLDNYKDTRFLIGVGGGFINKQIVVGLKPYKKKQFVLDEIGTVVTKLNATILKSFFNSDDVYPLIPSTLNEVRNAIAVSRIVVFGGLIEGVTTDTDTAIALEAAGGDFLINVSNTPYVYDKDPKEPGAKKLEKLTHEQMVELARKYDKREARTNFIFDMVASALAMRDSIRVAFADANVANIRLALDRKKHPGSLIE